MPREIKFRAWDTVRQKMFSAEEMGADELQLNPDGRGFMNADPNDTRLTKYFPHMIPLQYTGLKDKDKREIYDCDIVRLYTKKDEPWLITSIVWDGYGWGLEIFGNFSTLNCDAFKIEVAGNIYQNADLLEVRK